MKLIPTTNQQVAIWLLLLAGVSFALCFISITAPTPKLGIAEKNEPENTWKMPTMNTADEQIAFDKLNKLQPWGKETDEKATSSNKTGTVVNSNSLRLLGIMTTGKTRYALMADASQKVSRYRVNDKLPDESLIIDIEENTVTLKQVDTEEILKLYAPKMP
ncbi:hypothetical protein BegalDRAFT_1048 [Beggiatoa alba B18LD]|uniref:Type II secretion system protein GspC N-terminal domain-containing protein n=1 Tax=Beggiatoa alba B18LD TaxID=395493 RepID=I3CEA8_9GAMM|nr:type II secretion system protein N [Beggiatoa alba]EIJ41951.1 hypothetical protein BegalDRAFT_1048 [Beggiatoa alba B18LD]